LIGNTNFNTQKIEPGLNFFIWNIV